MNSGAYYRLPGYVNATPYISFDSNVMAGYIKIRRGRVVETKEVHPSVLLDVDADGQLLGIEILDAAFVELGEMLARK